MTFRALDEAKGKPTPLRRRAVASVLVALAATVLAVGAYLAVGGATLWISNQRTVPRGELGFVVMTVFAAGAVLLASLALWLARRAVKREGRRAKACLAPSTRPSCPYCRVLVGAREAEGTIRCSACETLHHAGCWKENGGCTTFACVRGRGARASDKVKLT